MKKRVLLTTILCVIIGCDLFSQPKDSVVFQCIKPDCQHIICFFDNGKYYYQVNWNNGKIAYNDGVYTFNSIDSSITFTAQIKTIDSVFVHECRVPYLDGYTIVFLMKSGIAYAPVDKVELITKNETRTIIFDCFGTFCTLNYKQPFVSGLKHKPEKLIVSYSFGGQYEIKLKRRKRDNYILVMADPQIITYSNNVFYFHTPWNHSAKINNNELRFEGNLFISTFKNVRMFH